MITDMADKDKLSQLKALGYDQFFEDNRQKLGVDIDYIARVTTEHKGAYGIISPSGEYRAAVSGKIMLNAVCRENYPGVGDWVIIKDSPDGLKVIEDILPRQTILRKKYSGKDEMQLIAANVKLAFIVESMDRDYNINRLERYIVLAQEGGVQPVIILNKSDLITKSELAERIMQLRERFGGIEILHTSTLADDGMQALQDYVQPGITYCFLGSSGVGKSSLINGLLDHDTIETKSIGIKTGRGRHTTTAREMYFTGEGGIIIDNPGSREVGVVGFGNYAKDVFIDINKYSKSCRFKDCKHQNEAGCAILGAMRSGDIDAMQYENYQKLQKENEHYKMSNQERRQKDKKFGKFIKNAKVDLKKYNSK